MLRRLGLCLMASLHRQITRRCTEPHERARPFRSHFEIYKWNSGVQTGLVAPITRRRNHMQLADTAHDDV